MGNFDRKREREREREREIFWSNGELKIKCTSLLENENKVVFQKSIWNVIEKTSANVYVRLFDLSISDHCFNLTFVQKWNNIFNEMKHIWLLSKNVITLSQNSLIALIAAHVVFDVFVTG